MAGIPTFSNGLWGPPGPWGPPWEHKYQDLVLKKGPETACTPEREKYSKAIRAPPRFGPSKWAPTESPFLSGLGGPLAGGPWETR